MVQADVPAFNGSTSRARYTRRFGTDGCISFSTSGTGNTPSRVRQRSVAAPCLLHRGSSCTGLWGALHIMRATVWKLDALLVCTTCILSHSYEIVTASHLLPYFIPSVDVLLPLLGFQPDQRSHACNFNPGKGPCPGIAESGTGARHACSSCVVCYSWPGCQNQNFA